MEPLPPPASVVLAVFTDADGFSTTDVLDVDDEVVRFDIDSDSLLWFDNTAFEGFPVDGNFIREDRFFQVLFGTEGGVKKAYFTETSTGTICDIAIDNGQIQILSTSRPASRLLSPLRPESPGRWRSPRAARRARRLSPPVAVERRSCKNDWYRSSHSKPVSQRSS